MRLRLAWLCVACRKFKIQSMNQLANTSFIPKESLTKKVQPARMGPPAASLLTAVSFVVLAVALMFGAGAFAYKIVLVKEINDPCSASGKCGLSESVEKERRALDPDRLTRYRRLDAKMKLATQIIDKHNTLLPFFNVLGSTTVKTLRYTKFSFGENNSVNLEGEAEGGYEDVAVQSKKLSEIRQIKSFMFSDLNMDDKGKVVFKLVVNLDPDLMSYRLYSDSAEVPLDFNPDLLPSFNSGLTEPAETSIASSSTPTP